MPFAELLTGTSFLAKRALFCSAFPMRLQSVTFYKKQSYITDLLECKINVFLACVLPSMPPTLSKGKKKKEKT